MREGWDQLRRDHPPVVAAATRASSLQIVEENFPDEAARTQAARCLRCNVNTVFDTEICVSCTGCIDVCPENLIRLTGLAELCRTPDGRAWVAGYLRLRPPNSDATARAVRRLGGVMLKDETTCIRCGLCASRCPSHAITMQRFDFHRMCVTAGGRNPKLNYGNGGPQQGDGQASSQSPALQRP